MPPHRGRPAVVALLPGLHADLGVAVGRVEPARLLPLLPLLQELEGQPRGAHVHVLGEHEARDGGGDLHVALVPRLFPHDGVSVGVTRPVTLRRGNQIAHSSADGPLCSTFERATNGEQVLYLYFLVMLFGQIQINLF